jgi:hypothetical protein
MESASAWNNLEVAKLLVSILTPLAIAVLGILVNKRFRDSELKHERDRDNEQLRREEEKNRREVEEQKRREEKEAQEKARQEELTRLYKPHIEFDIDCRFFGPKEGKYAVEFLLTANNKGTTRHEFRSIILRVRGIRDDEPLTFWTERYEHRLKFPVPIVKDEVKAENHKYIFIEPGVKQCLSYQTIIDAEIKYITARAEFFYDPEKKYTPHSTEKMFEVRGSV